MLKRGSVCNVTHCKRPPNHSRYFCHIHSNPEHVKNENWNHLPKCRCGRGRIWLDSKWARLIQKDCIPRCTGCAEPKFAFVRCKGCQMVVDWREYSPHYRICRLCCTETKVGTCPSCHSRHVKKYNVQNGYECGWCHAHVRLL